MNQIDEEKLKESSRTFRVSDATRFLAITPRILKHYEAAGVIEPKRSADNDYRAYTAEEIIKIQIAEQLKEAGFTAREIGGYFSGELDIRAAYDKLADLRERLDHLLSLIAYDLRPNEPSFSFSEKKAQLCYVAKFPLRDTILQKYFDARNTYCGAIGSGCSCGRGSSGFFFLFGEEEGMYRVCVPVRRAPKKLLATGAAERICRGRSFVAKMTGEAGDTDRLRAMLFAEAERRGLKLSKITWSLSEMGPNRKTALRLYSLIVGAELEE